MIRTALIAILILSTISGYGQRKLKKLEVEEQGFNINMKFQPVVDKMTFKGLTINVTPISADELNTLFLEESFFNGKFNYSNYKRSRESYFLKKNRGKRKKSDLEFFFEGINWLYDNDKIDKAEYDDLEKQIIYHFDEKYAELYYSNSEITNANPYYFNGKYLNVFKVKISNPTASHITLDKDLIVENGNTLLSQISSRVLFKQLDSIDLLNLNKSMTLERHNLYRGVIIPPNSEVEKLLAVLPIDFNHPRLNMSMDGASSKLSWEIIKDKKTINELYTFYELELKWKNDYDIKFSILSGNTNSVFLDENEVFVGDRNVSNLFGIFTIALDGNNLYYGRNTNLKGSDFIDNVKNRRKTISLDLQKIEELKKKVKE